MKMGIIGYGAMAQWHKQTIEKIDELEIAGIWDCKEAARIRAKEDGIQVYSSLDEILKDTEIDFVLIATSNESHASIAIEAMNNEKHVVCEKPITLSCDLLDEMIKVSEKTQKILTVHQNRRWDNDYCTVKKIIEDGTLGNIFKIESRVHGSRGISNTWRRYKEYGGGVIYDWGVHLIDQILMLKKGVELESVYAASHKVSTDYVEDGFMAVLTFRDGMQVIIEVETNDFIGFNRWYLFGNNGTAVIRNWSGEGKAVYTKHKESEEVIPLVTKSGFTKTMAPRSDDTICEKNIVPVDTDISEFYKNFMASIKGVETPIITFAEMRNVMKVIEAIFESIENNQAVKCELDFKEF